jgi:thiol:disulfide interchange protein DsbD
MSEQSMMLAFCRRRFAAWRAMLLFLLFLLLPCARPALADDGFLPPEQAFRLSARMLNASSAEVKFAIVDGYYLYRERFAFKAQGAELGTPQVPAGTVHFDDTLQKQVETYRKTVAIRIPLQASAPFTLTVTAQGCSDKGLCYPPMTSTVKLAPAKAGAVVSAVGPGEAAQSKPGMIASALTSRNLLVIVPMFLVLGLGLAFTPCVLPMVPIMSSIIVGSQGNTPRRRGFVLSLSYSAGMAIVYTLFGVAAGLAGQGLAAALQNPWVLGGFALLMALFALSMFGLYPLEMPAAIQARLLGTSSRRAAGTHAGVFAMGALSALIVGPCVAAPLAGALVYISQTRDAFVGGTAQFAMAVGMSIPLLLIGASAGALLPRAGAWMEEVKRFFGVLLLASAWWIVAPVLPGHLQMAGWAALGIGYAAWLLLRRPAGMARLAVGMLFGIAGVVQLAGAVAGGSDPLAPFSHTAEANASRFRRVKSVAELDAALASSRGTPILLDFYADWCVSCREMEKSTFADARVRERLDGMLLLRADVTANDDQDKALLKRFGLFGPPGIILFDTHGRELPAARVIGYQDPVTFLNSLATVAE